MKWYKCEHVCKPHWFKCHQCGESDLCDKRLLVIVAGNRELASQEAVRRGYPRVDSTKNGWLYVSYEEKLHGLTDYDVFIHESASRLQYHKLMNIRRCIDERVAMNQAAYVE